jgi:hypothetical protein
MIWTAYVGLSLLLPTLRLQSSLVWNSYTQVLVLVWALLWFLLIANPKKLTEAVTTVVQEALQPASVNVWLRRTTPATGRPAERVK